MIGCIPRFNCVETVSAICDDTYEYKCPYFEPQCDPEYDFSRYCKYDESRCSLCSSQDAILASIRQTLKLYGRTIGRVVYKVDKPVNYGEDSFNNKG